MRIILTDKNVPWRVAEALRILEYDAFAVGYHEDAPVGDSTDDELCVWCKAHGDALLVTGDRGKKDREMIESLRKHNVHALFLYRDLRTGSPRDTLLAILKAEARIVQSCQKSLLHHRLKSSGRIESR